MFVLYSLYRCTRYFSPPWCIHKLLLDFVRRSSSSLLVVIYILKIPLNIFCFGSVLQRGGASSCDWIPPLCDITLCTRTIPPHVPRSIDARYSWKASYSARTRPRPSPLFAMMPRPETACYPSSLVSSLPYKLLSHPIIFEITRSLGNFFNGRQLHLEHKGIKSKMDRSWVNPENSFMHSFVCDSLITLLK